jgi:hypothetical protein
VAAASTMQILIVGLLLAGAISISATRPGVTHARRASVVELLTPSVSSFACMSIPHA